jgi:hypothetical protein
MDMLIHTQATSHKIRAEEETSANLERDRLLQRIQLLRKCPPAFSTDHDQARFECEGRELLSRWRTAFGETSEASAQNQEVCADWDSKDD